MHSGVSAIELTSPASSFVGFIVALTRFFHVKLTIGTAKRIMRERSPVPLVRQFSPVPTGASEGDDAEIQMTWGIIPAKRWDDLIANSRTVILAESGSGKTFEMLAQAKHLAANDKSAFFLRLEDLATTLDQSFEIGTRAQFVAWLEGETDAWFFLDSVDEARLRDPRQFENSIKHFAAAVGNALSRARIILSSRPYAWRSASDLELLERYLPNVNMALATSIEKHPTENFYTNVVQSEASNGEVKQIADVVSIYQLRRLNEADIRAYAIHRAASRVDEFMLQLKRANLLSVADRPFDLEELIKLWNAGDKLENRVGVLRQGITRRLNEIDQNRIELTPINAEKARAGARLLAAAVTFTGFSAIRTSAHPGSGPEIDPNALLTDWVTNEQKWLLNSGIFSDALYGAVRIRHREMRDLLVAEWFAEMLENGCPRSSVMALCFVEMYGEKVIRPRLRSVLPWLILSDTQICTEALAIEPMIALEGGDPSQLPLVTRRGILTETIARLVTGDAGRNGQDNSSIALIAQLDLESDTNRLIEQHYDNDDAIFFLGRLVWQGKMTTCIDALGPIARDAARGIFARQAALRAISVVGGADERSKLWLDLLTDPARLNQKLLAELVRSSPPDATTVRALLDSITTVDAVERFDYSGLSTALHDFVDSLPVGPIADGTPPLAELVAGLVTLLEQAPLDEDGDWHFSVRYRWLLRPTIHAVERLISARDAIALTPVVLAFLLKCNQMTLMSFHDLDDRASQLHARVPEWPDLNDALFWASVADARAKALATTGDSLAEDWPVIWQRHVWRFDGSGFERVMGFVRSRALLDDRLVALALAYRIHRENGSAAERLADLRNVVGDNSALTAALELALNPPVTEMMLARQASSAAHQAKVAEFEKSQMEHRAAWAASLRSDPSQVLSRSDHSPETITESQLYLLRNLEGERIRVRRAKGSAWRTLSVEFGDEVACAFRDAAVSKWRQYTPTLGSDFADRTSDPGVLDFAACGLDIDVKESTDFFGRLTDEDARHAMRYVFWEMNGFPEWFERLYHAFPKLVQEVVWQELDWEFSQRHDDRDYHYVLDRVTDQTPWLHSCLSESLLARLRGNDSLDQHRLTSCLRILIGAGTSKIALARLAEAKIIAEHSLEQLPRWFALWVSAEPERSIASLESKLASMEDSKGAVQFAEQFVLAFVGEQHANGAGATEALSSTHLMRLYLLMHRFIRHEHDINRTSERVYRPGARDDAQQSREHLLGILAARPGENTYRALKQLEIEHPVASYRKWMGQRARERAIDDADLELWSAQQVKQFATELEIVPASVRQLFELVCARLGDFKHWLERGNDSLATTYQKITSETEMRNVVFNWLNSKSSGRYVATQEPELANAQRPDLWVQSPQVESEIPIELKIAEKWTGPELCERLRNQLAGDYLRERTARGGIMLLVRCNGAAKEHWEINAQSGRFADLPQALEHYWTSINVSYPNIESIRVIGIDLTLREMVASS
jgi:hypothetical protein